MILRPFLNDESSCASYLFGCLTHAQLAVVDPHADLVDAYLEAAAAIGAPITAVFETHVQADHVSGLPALVDAHRRAPICPVGAGVDFEHDALADGDRSRWATPSSALSPRRATRLLITRTRRRTSAAARASPGWRSPATRC